MFQPQDFAESLVRWFRESQREMPWRRAENAGDAYRILVSEVMLQQTTVAAVTPFFERFIARFPDVQTLAAAPESEVLAHWSGLGYYARARNLQKAARTIVDEYGGQFPRDFDAILSLPGVGRYTAGAVSSIAFGTRAPIVDANVARVLSRVLLVDGDLKTAANQAKLWDGATQIVQAESVEPREINPALMEIGALVCVPNRPRCEVCPVANWCAARACNRQNEVPQIAPKRAPTPMFDACAYVVDDGRFLLRRRADEPGVWWRAMWELPRVTRAVDETPQSALERLGREIGVELAPLEREWVVKHGVTRFWVELECWSANAQNVVSRDDLGWFDLTGALALPMPSSMKTLLRALDKRAGKQLKLELNG